MPKSIAASKVIVRTSLGPAIPPATALTSSGHRPAGRAATADDDEVMRPLTRCLAAALGCLALSGIATVVPVYAVPPKGACSNPEPAHPTVRMLPWAQQLLMPQRVWPYSTGTGVTVAVVDSGVDADHPQLRRPGKVLPGRDFFLVGKLPGNYDCVSHGTAVAGLISADAAPGIGFQGIAPGARILPVRVSDREANDSGGTRTIDSNVLAAGIKYAADRGAKVMNLSMAGPANQPQVRAAIAYAVRKDVVIVAAVGNGQQDRAQRVPSYPAGYPGVIGVGAIDISGARANSSQIGAYVDLMAPGAGVLSTTRRAGHAYVDGTSFAAPFVAATAALVRSAWPKLTAAQVAQRLRATASPARGGAGSQEYGAGVVDPYRAVTEGLDASKGRAMPPMAEPPVDQQQLAVVAWWVAAGNEARAMTGLALAGVATVILVSAILAAGRRRRWTAARTSLPRSRRPQAPEPPPDQLFRTPA
ncbi:type VII secretion-associated serine protease mycosin [Kribbella sp. NPDC051620]|uniref:type VII secretion-associated serine protease mycosin n=1 Tax=Kribbella sp. NPDC051620 TaxID=3364120 RepID=UPI0037902236